ncbi:unnamed protein product [Moneuplotes crassus]|uniref:Uncharacterized protein n=1 Tax=Euplotes crassus TaxID=5936 RepID=A0AAD1UAP2_EUPCR|nr:unnamed protein product [Moneuplotes crassus]
MTSVWTLVSSSVTPNIPSYQIISYFWILFGYFYSLIFINPAFSYFYDVIWINNSGSNKG